MPRRGGPEPAQRQTRIETLGDEIAGLSAQIQAATHRLLTLIREFDERGGWQPEGFQACAHWLAWRTGIELGAAREKVRVARALLELPQTAAALERGEPSYAKVRALSRVAQTKNEAHFLEVARHGTAPQLERVVRATRRADRAAENERAERQQLARYLSWRSEEDGTVRLEARLPAEAGARVLRALSAAVDALAIEAGGKSEEGIGARRADALVRLADGALSAGLPGCRAADKQRVVVHVDAAVLADADAEGRSSSSTELLAVRHGASSAQTRDARQRSIPTKHSHAALHGQPEQSANIRVTRRQRAPPRPSSRPSGPGPRTSRQHDDHVDDPRGNDRGRSISVGTAPAPRCGRQLTTCSTGPSSAAIGGDTWPNHIFYGGSECSRGW